MIAFRFIVPKIILLGKSVAAALLLAGIAAETFAQTSVALSPALPPRDVFQQLENVPGPLTRPEPAPIGAIAVVDLRRIVLQRDGEADSWPSARGARSACSNGRECIDVLM